MADTLFSSAEAKAQLDSGVVAKLSKAAEASSLLTVTAQGTVMGVQWRRVAEAAELSAAEMGALRDWIEEIHSKEAADRFSSSLPSVAVTVKSELPAAALAPAAPTKFVFPASESAAPAPTSEFERLMAASAPAVEDPFGLRSGSLPLPSPMSETEREDVLAHGFDSGKIASLTWLIHTARPCPPNSADFKYGVDPSAVRKLYGGLQSSVGTLLWELVKSDSSSMKDFQNHFYRAVQAAVDADIRARISTHWTEMMQYFDSVEMVRAYYKKFLTIRSGRGLPKIIDEHIVMLVMCSELERTRGGASSSAAAEMQAMASSMEKQTRAFESFKETVTELKAKVGELKSQVNDLKTGHASLKEKVASIKGGRGGDARVCGFCGAPGHTEAYCHKKQADEAAKKPTAEA